MINSIDEEKAFDKIHHPFKITFPERVGKEEIHFKILKAISEKHTVNSIIM